MRSAWIEEGVWVTQRVASALRPSGVVTEEIGFGLSART